MNDRNLTGKMKENYRFFGIGTALYAGFTPCVCIKTAEALPLLFYRRKPLVLLLMYEKLEVSLKKAAFLSGDGDAAGGIDLYNGDGRIIAMNKTGIFS